MLIIEFNKLEVTKFLVRTGKLLYKLTLLPDCSWGSKKESNTTPLMGPCWWKCLSFPEEEQDDSAALGMIPITEVSRNVTSELVITPSN